MFYILQTCVLSFTEKFTCNAFCVAVLRTGEWGLKIMAHYIIKTFDVVFIIYLLSRGAKANLHVFNVHGIVLTHKHTSCVQCECILCVLAAT